MPLAVSFVVVNWNTRDLLLRCVDSIAHSVDEGISYEVVVVDNASDDGSVEALGRQSSNVRLMRNALNEGFARAVNRGIQASTGEFLFIMNPDVLLMPGSVQRLIRRFDEYRTTGMITPRLVNADGSEQTGYLRKLPGLGQLVFFHTVLQSWSLRKSLIVRAFSQHRFERAEGVEEVEQIPGACMLVPRRIVDQIGGMDERFRLFFEDVDWSSRMKEKGWKLLVDHDVSAIHEGGRSFMERDNFWMHGRFMLSMLLYFDKHGTWYEKLFSKVIAVLNSIVVVVSRVLWGVVAMGSLPRESQRKSVRRHTYFLREVWRHYVQKKSERVD